MRSRRSSARARRSVAGALTSFVILYSGPLVGDHYNIRQHFYRASMAKPEVRVHLPERVCFLASEVRERGHGFGKAERLVFSSAFRLGWSGASAQLEDSPSGLWRTLGKRVGCKPSGVRIPHPPPSFIPGIAMAPGMRISLANAPSTGAGEGADPRRPPGVPDHSHGRARSPGNPAPPGRSDGAPRGRRGGESSHRVGGSV